MKQRRNIVPIVLCLLFACEAVLFPLSWIASTIWQESGIMSLLSPDGIRWFVGNHARLLSTPYLVWLLLAGISAGIVKDSGILHPKKGWTLQVTLFVLVVMLSAIGLLSFSPHAILLSATGNLLDSSFSAGIVPALCFVACCCALTYGTLESKYATLNHIYTAALCGINMVAPYILLYLFTAQLYFTIQYILP